MDREKFLEKLFPLIGGKENTSLCEFQDDMLSITLKDAGLADENAVAKLPDVASAALRRGRLTVTFGEPERKEEVPFMANNEKLINEILRAVGGKENVSSATHCITRLRFRLIDVKKADIEEVKKISFAVLMLQGIATSIDALSVGFTIADYGFVMALVCSIIIAVVTFAICETGLYLGKTLGTKLAGKADVLGGVILTGIGIEIFVKGVFF